MINTFVTYKWLSSGCNKFFHIMIPLGITNARKLYFAAGLTQSPAVSKMGKIHWFLQSIHRQVIHLKAGPGQDWPKQGVKTTSKCQMLEGKPSNIYLFFALTSQRAHHAASPSNVWLILACLLTLLMDGCWNYSSRWMPDIQTTFQNPHELCLNWRASTIT